MNDNVSVISGENIKVETKENKKIIYFGIKRLFDIFCSLLGLILILPLALIIKIAYLIAKDYNSIFYFQERIGKNGKIIHIYKFRTMVYNADEVLKELLKDPKYKKEWDENQKLDKDPRITKIGKFLRKTSLDEIPQFINVFLGDMSMIGPRPLIKGELDKHNGNHELYEKIRPGITGWWACNGRSATTYEERLKLEYYYINNLNIWLDVKCIFKTISVVIFKKGAK